MEHLIGDTYKKKTPLTEFDTQYLDSLWGAASAKNKEDIFIRRSGVAGHTFGVLQSMGGIGDVCAERYSPFKDICRRYGADDLFFTPNSFCLSGRTGGDNHEHNLFAVYSWALDIDYKRAYEAYYGKACSRWTQAVAAETEAMRPREPLEYWEGVLRPLFEELMLPVPNWIEYGHQIRLIYILEEPIRAAVKSGKVMIAALKCIMQRFVKILNDSDPSIGAEPQKLGAYYRVPGSINTKDGSRVGIVRVCDKLWSVQDIFEEWMPKLPGWYVAWKAKKQKHGKRKKSSPDHINILVILRSRIEAFCRLRTLGGIPREKLLFFYGNTLAQVEPEKDIMDALLMFNRGFPVPLSEKEIKAKLRRTGKKIYKYTTDKIASELGVTRKILVEYGMYVNHRDAERKRLAAEKRFLRQETHRQTLDLVDYMRSHGLTQREVAEKLGVSVRTVQRYEREYREIRLAKNDATQRRNDAMKAQQGQAGNVSVCKTAAEQKRDTVPHETKEVSVWKYNKRKNGRSVKKSGMFSKTIPRHTDRLFGQPTGSTVSFWLAANTKQTHLQHSVKNPCGDPCSFTWEGKLLFADNAV